MRLTEASVTLPVHQTAGTAHRVTDVALLFDIIKHFLRIPQISTLLNTIVVFRKTRGVVSNWSTATSPYALLAVVSVYCTSVGRSASGPKASYSRDTPSYRRPIAFAQAITSTIKTPALVIVGTSRRWFNVVTGDTGRTSPLVDKPVLPSNLFFWSKNTRPLLCRGC